MKDNLSCQIYIVNLDFSFESIESILLDSSLVYNFLITPMVKIKKFLGSDINIDGSGFLWQDNNDNSFSFEIKNKILPNFMKSYFFKIININNCYITENISIEINFYKNSDNNTTIIEICFGQFANNNYTKWVREKLLDFKIKDYFKNVCYKIKEHIINSSKELIKIYNSILIKTNYKNVYKIFTDFNNTAKVLGTDKIWEIKYDNSIYSVKLKNGVFVNYHIYKEIENPDISKSAFYHKYSGNIPSLNEWTIVNFYNINKDRCLIIHETKLPKNINSSVQNIILKFTVYILKKLKKLIESKNCKDKI